MYRVSASAVRVIGCGPPRSTSTISGAKKKAKRIKRSDVTDGRSHLARRDREQESFLAVFSSVVRVISVPMLAVGERIASDATGSQASDGEKSVGLSIGF